MDHTSPFRSYVNRRMCIWLVCLPVQVRSNVSVSCFVLFCVLFCLFLCLPVSKWRKAWLVCTTEPVQISQRGHSHGEQHMLHPVRVTGAKGPYWTPPFPLHACAAKLHKPGVWRPCHFARVLQITARPCCMDCSCIPPAWLWHLNCMPLSCFSSFLDSLLPCHSI